MFTGIVEEMGRVVANVVQGHTSLLTVEAPVTHADAHLGDSISINGCCLTVVAQEGNLLTFDAMPETMARTNLGSLCAGDRVNLERSLAVGGRLGGHFVQGHVDGSGTILALHEEENAVVIEIGVPSSLRRYIVEKGSIAVDGVSLTVSEVRPESFTVWTIPHTRQVTTLGQCATGDRVNLECDLLGKYIEQIVAERLERTLPAI